MTSTTFTPTPEHELPWSDSGPATAPAAPVMTPAPAAEIPAAADAPASSASTPPTRMRRLWRGPADDPAWARPSLLVLLVATAALYLVNLTANGWANAYYSAAAQAGSSSWSAFFFGSSDAGNSITVDKTPASLWAMALSVRLLGLSSFAMLLPEALMGVASVGVLYATVKRHFGAGAGLIAGAVLALTPVAVLMFRFNNPEALLVLLMTLAAWATVKSVERASPRWFMLVGVFIGLGFLTKMLQVLLVVPAFALAYLVAAPTTLRRRIWHSLLGALAILVSAGWWIAIVELLPANLRPYIGGSQTNSVLELTLGYNGLGRLNGNETGSVVPGGNPGAGMWGETGWLRMFGSSIGGQVAWLLPAALVLLVAGLALRGRRPRTDARRAAYLAWGGWLVVTTVTFSLMAGIFHDYYTIALAPAIGALVGMGLAELWERRESAAIRVVLAVLLAGTSVWAFVLLARTETWLPWLRVVVLGLGMACAVLLLVVTAMPRRAVPALVGAALVAALAAPTAYSLQTAGTAHSGSIVTAGPSTGRGSTGGAGGRGGFAAGLPGTQGGPGTTLPGPGGTQLAPGGQAGPGGTRFGRGAIGGDGGGLGGLLDATAPSAAIVQALSANADQFTWVAATVGAQSAAGLQLGTGLPVMPIGGFNGSDPSPTLAEFQAYVADGQIHYFAAGSGRGGGLGSNGAGAEIASWVQSGFASVTIGGTTFYDLTQPLGSGASTSASTSST